MIDDSGVSDVFRTEWPRVVATLVRDFGDLDLAQDVTQEAFIAAAESWTPTSRPDRPGAWLVTTARRRAIDRIRRDRRFTDRMPELVAASRLGDDDDPSSDHELVDDQLALVLACCHPALAPDAQVALTLRVVAGLSTGQIARAFLVSESTMTRRLTRAKTKIRVANIPFRVADRELLVDRLPIVSAVVYSIFTEGHTSATSTTLVRGDLCDEAIWLAELLVELVPDDPELAGLCALLLLTDARRASRVDDAGGLVLLADQDRSAWDRAKISRGLALLAAAHSHGSSGPYQLLAAIAALHAAAPAYELTDWDRVIALYDALLVRNADAVTSLNRAAAIGQRDGADRGLAVLAALTEEQTEELAEYPYFHACRAEFLLILGDREAARVAFDHAISTCRNDTERSHLLGRREIAETSA